MQQGGQNKMFGSKSGQPKTSDLPPLKTKDQKSQENRGDGDKKKTIR